MWESRALPERLGIQLCCSLLVLGCLAGGTGSDMTAIQSAKVERFKAQIGFNDVISRERPTELPAPVWPDMLRAPGLAAGQWHVVADTTWQPGRGVARQWVLRRGQEQLAIVAFVSSDGPEPARDFFVSRATDNMMQDSPFVRLEGGPGTLAVGLPEATPASVIWLSHNLCFAVRAIDTDVAVLPIARWLQSVATGGAPPNPA
jgi:hypothetical protein